MRVVEAEQAVLGGLMLREDAFWLVSGELAESDFARADHRLIFRAIREMLTSTPPQPVDAVTLGEWFESNGLLEQVARGAYLVELAATTPSTANIRAYAQIVARAGEKRRVRDAGLLIASEAEGYADAHRLLAGAEPRLVARSKSTKDALGEMVETLQNRFDAEGEVTGVPTGLESLDAITSGWQPGSLIVLAARPGMGKTAFAVQAAIAAKRAHVISLEMTAGELIERATCNIGEIPHRWMKFPREAPDYAMDRISRAAAEVARLRLTFNDRAGVSIDAIESSVRQEHAADPLSLIVVDHLGLIDRAFRNDASELGGITSRLKRLAKEVAPVLLLCQLNRALENRADKRPQLSDLRDSGRIEEDADMVIGLYREGYYNLGLPSERDYLEAIVLKHRSGEKGTAWGRPLLGQMRIETCDEPERSTSTTATAQGRGGFASQYGKGGKSRPLPRTGSDH